MSNLFVFILPPLDLQTSSVSRTAPDPDVVPYPSQAPPPAPPSLSKMEIYSDPSVFSDIDQVAINVSVKVGENNCNEDTVASMYVIDCVLFIAGRS